MTRVKDKTIVVTGGALGIGKACCLLAAQEGARVAVTDRLEGQAKEVASMITSQGGAAESWGMDVTDEESVKRVFSAIAGRFGGIDVLVNNAGVSGADKPPDELTVEEWQLVMEVNVQGVFLCTKHVIPYLRKQGGGSIINLSSIYGIIGATDIPAYHASKGAVRAMTKTDALYYAREKIRVNSIHPGFIWTPLVEDLGRRSELGIGTFRKQLDSLHPIGHVGEPDDVAYGVLYLASDEAKFVTGSELVIDGGYTAR